jgi:hypothetical protein
MISKEEQDAVDELIANQSKAKIECFEYMKYLSRLSAEQLQSSGYRNGLGTALIAVLSRTLKEIDNLQREFLSKYPDEK